MNKRKHVKTNMVGKLMLTVGSMRIIAMGRIKTRYTVGKKKKFPGGMVGELVRGLVYRKQKVRHIPVGYQSILMASFFNREAIPETGSSIE